MSIPTLTDDDRDELRRLLEIGARFEDMDGMPTQFASDCSHFLPKLALRTAALESRRSSRPPRNESTSAMRLRVRAEVKERAGGRCEFRDASTGTRCTSGGVIGDHFWGRGRDDTTEGVWLLCVTHDQGRTRNEPSRYAWILSFRQHALAMEYAEQVEKCERMGTLERGQHPGRASTS
jgi:hypothetical protein